MKPLSESPTDWQYSLEELINVENTVGGISVGEPAGHAPRVAGWPRRQLHVGDGWALADAMLAPWPGRRVRDGAHAGDVDGDGWAEIFVPNYDDGEVHVFTYGPAP